MFSLHNMGLSSFDLDHHSILCERNFAFVITKNFACRFLVRSIKITPFIQLQLRLFHSFIGRSMRDFPA